MRGRKDMFMEIVPNRKKETLHNLVNAKVHQSSIVFTDGWTGYNGLKTEGIVKDHRRCNHSEAWVNYKDPVYIPLAQGEI